MVTDLGDALVKKSHREGMAHGMPAPVRRLNSKRNKSAIGHIKDASRLQGKYQDRASRERKLGRPGCKADPFETLEGAALVTAPREGEFAIISKRDQWVSEIVTGPGLVAVVAVCSRLFPGVSGTYKLLPATSCESASNLDPWRNRCNALHSNDFREKRGGHGWTPIEPPK